MTDALLHASGVAIEIDGRELVSNVDLRLGMGESLGIVGETGSGKSLTCRALSGSLGTIGGRISRGHLSLAGRDLTSSIPSWNAGLYGRVVSVIPQNSLSSLNPLMRIGNHLVETIKALDGARNMSATDYALELLDRVGLPASQRTLRQYPHQLSGGMRQRVMIALAIAGRPQLLIADEPTTALDVSVQKEILVLLRRLTEEDGMALVLVSHDLGVVSEVAQSIAVMYAGMVVENGPTDRVLRRPRHPYSRALIEARPSLGSTQRLIGIPGAPATPDAWPRGCRFGPRCQDAKPECHAAVPKVEHISAAHTAACIRVKEVSPFSRELET